MRYQTAALLVGIAYANPVPQGFDWDAIDAIEPIRFAETEIPVVNAAAAQTTLPAPAATAAAASVSAAVYASPSDTSLKVRGTLAMDNGCTANANDTPESFSSNDYYQESAETSQKPSGYTLAYQDQNGSSQGVLGYMGYSILDQYNQLECASRCDTMKGCQSFNIYFERDPSVDPTDSCPNPPSKVVIKCVYYGGPVTAASATNDGQWSKDFHVVIAGSNGFVNNSITTPAGYSNPTFLDRAAINAPKDCNGQDTYMTVKTFTGVFDVANCANACSAQNEYNRNHPRQSDGYFPTCQFFNTYVLYNDSTAVGQYCALYNETWPSTFATNNGQWRGSNWFNINYSYTFSNTTGGLDTPAGCNNPTASSK
ncbi:hypothetical protein Slin15195_G055280 [Septoria linicola]|uniref:Uncharacterized protein n=1 Tax=Septoria linicola TaxID=215465 RepID=A0A9Q9APR6_9PEZI|nr:hypothetical protein Slin15195_G055280 [Septoria linicola]